MTRLPIPGSDDGAWGQILNDYLSQSHNIDGSIKHGAVTKSDIGLSNVDNTSDADKPISIATQSALDNKADSANLASKVDSADLDDLNSSLIQSSSNTSNALGLTYAPRIKYASKSRTAGDVTITSTNLIAYDTALDLTLGAAVGDLLEVNLNAQAASAANVALDWNVAILVNNVNVRQLGGTGNGAITAWSIRMGDYHSVSGSVTTIVQAADIQSGSITLRLLVKAGSATGRAVLGTAAYPTQWWARNFGPIN